MSLYGVLRSGVSGMNAQSNKLGTVAENIQNSSTTGYKRASTEFASLILPSSEGNYNSGYNHRLRDGVEAKASPRPTPRDDAENQEDTATNQVEGQQLAQRMWMQNEAVEPKANQGRAGQSREN